MTNQDINRICTQYLNDCESELEVQDVFNLAEKALKYKTAIEDIKADIKRYEAECVLSDINYECKACDKIMFSSIYQIIDKHLKKAESEEEE